MPDPAPTLLGKPLEFSPNSLTYRTSFPNASETDAVTVEFKASGKSRDGSATWSAVVQFTPHTIYRSLDEWPLDGAIQRAEAALRDLVAGAFPILQAAVDAAPEAPSDG